LVEANKNKKKEEEKTRGKAEKKKKKNPFSESDDARFRHPSNDKKKEKLVSPSDPRE